MRNRTQSKLVSQVLLCLLLFIPRPAAAFTVHRPRSRSSQSTTLLPAITNNKKGADFEYQEMKVVLDAMKRQGVASGNLEASKRQELESYVRAVVQARPSNTALSKSDLVGHTWRLAFSSEDSVVGDLPRDATVLLDFRDESTMDYKLQFSKKTFGLNNLVATSSYQLVNNILEFVYETVTTDVFGFQKLNVGFFGLLKGRVNYVSTSYFDGSVWIEQTSDFVNVYVLEDDDWTT